MFPQFFPTTLGRADLFPAATLAVVAGVPTRLGRFPVPLGQIYGYGRGPNLGQTETEGRILVDLRDNTASPGAAVQGVIRLVALNQLDQEAHVYYELRSEQARLGASVLTDRMILPAYEPLIGEGFSLALVVIPDTSVTLGSANTIIAVDARRARRV